MKWGKILDYIGDVIKILMINVEETKMKKVIAVMLLLNMSLIFTLTAIHQETVSNKEVVMSGNRK